MILSRYPDVRLRPMSQVEYKKYSELSLEGFVHEAAKASGDPIEVVRARAGTLPETPKDTDLWLIVEANGVHAGYLWVRLDPQTRSAFGYDISIEPTFRSQGIGRAAMLKGREILRGHGIERLKVCVFDENTVARTLYESLGFREVSANAQRRQRTLEAEV